MSELKNKEIKDIGIAVNSYNNSPWFIEGDEYDLEDTLKRAKEKGSAVILEGIRRDDIRAFHAEEGRCGNI